MPVTQSVARIGRARTFSDVGRWLHDLFPGAPSCRTFLSVLGTKMATLALTSCSHACSTTKVACKRAGNIRYVSRVATRNTTSKTCITQSCNLLQQLQLHAWVENPNIGQGIAPESSFLIRRPSTNVPLKTTCTLVRSGMKMKIKLQWLRKWRQHRNNGLGP